MSDVQLGPVLGREDIRFVRRPRGAPPARRSNPAIPPPEVTDPERDVTGPGASAAVAALPARWPEQPTRPSGHGARPPGVAAHAAEAWPRRWPYSLVTMVAVVVLLVVLG